MMVMNDGSAGLVARREKRAVLSLDSGFADSLVLRNEDKRRVVVVVAVFFVLLRGRCYGW